MSAVEHPHSLAEYTGQMQLLVDFETAGVATRTSFQLTDPSLAYETYEGIGAYLGEVYRRVRWYLGDWLNFGSGVYGEMFAQAVHETGLNEQTILHYQFVCKNVAAEIRDPTLGFGVHALVARLEPREQKLWLKKAAKGGWTEVQLREAMRAKRKDTAPPLFDPEEGAEGADSGALVEVARAILRDARPHENDESLIILPKDDIARLEAALGGY